MAVAQLEVQTQCKNKIFVMQSSNFTLGPYFTYAKNEKRLNKKHKKTSINNLPQILKVLSLASHSFLQ